MKTLSSGGAAPCVTHIVHIADIHVRMGGRAAARIDEYATVFDAFCEEIGAIPAVREGTALLVIAGDVFHNKGRTDSEGAILLFQWLNRLLNMLPVLAIVGNHDFRQEDPEFADMLDMVNAALSMTQTKYAFHYLKDTGVYRWENVAFGVVSVKDTLRAFNTSGVVDELPSFPRVEADLRRIALFHGTICQSALPSGRSADTYMKGYPLEWFKGYEMVLLGDNHKQQINYTGGEDRMDWGYPGSLVQQDFGEAVFGHGYLLWDVASKTATAHHIYNPFGTLTISRNNMVHLGSKESMHLDDAYALAGFPTHPKVRIIGVDSDAGRIVSELGSRGISPTFVKVSKADDRDRHHSARANDHGASASVMLDLNNPERWEAFIAAAGGPTDESDRAWIYDPTNLLVPYVGTLLTEEITKRNQKIQVCIDAYEKERQHATARSHTVALQYMEWDHLMCFGKDNHFDFERMEGHVALLNGRNATGKSSFLDVLCIALCGCPTTLRTEFNGANMTAKIINDRKPHTSTESARVRLILSVGGTSYEVNRSFSHTSDEYVQAKTTAIYELCPIDDLKYVVAEGVVQVNAWIARHVGTLDEIMMSTVLCQTDNANFFHLKPTEQRAMLEKALHMQTITEFEIVLDESINAHRHVLKELAKQRATIEETTGDDGRHGTVTEEEVKATEETERVTRERMEGIYRRMRELEKYAVETDMTLADAEAVGQECMEDGAFAVLEHTVNTKVVLGSNPSLDVVALRAVWDEHAKHKVKSDMSEAMCLGVIAKGQEWMKRHGIGEGDSIDVSLDVNIPVPRPKKKSMEQQQDAAVHLDVAELQRVTEELTELAGAPIVLTRPVQDARAVQLWNQRLTAWRALKKEAGGTSVAELEDRHQLLKEYVDKVDDIRAAVERLQRDRDDCLRSLKALRTHHEYDPNCRFCCMHNNVKQIQQLESDIEHVEGHLKQANKRLKRCDVQAYADAVQEIDTIARALPLRREVEARREEMATEQAAWRVAEEQYKEMRVRQARIDELGAVAWGIYDVYQTYKQVSAEMERARHHIDIARAESAWKARDQELRSAIAEAQWWEDKERYDAAVVARTARATIAWYELCAVRTNATEAENAWRAAMQALANVRAAAVTSARSRERCTSLQDATATIEARLTKMTAFRAVFVGDAATATGFKHHLYTHVVLPLIEKEVNAFIHCVDTFTFRICMKKNKFVYMLEDRGSTPSLDHASGYQKFIVGLGMRAALCRVGAVGQNLKHLFIDEGFVAMDATNITKVGDILQELVDMGGYKSMLLMSHLDVIREATAMRVDIGRDADNTVSTIRWGERRPRVAKGFRETAAGSAPKGRGRPRKR